MSLRFWPALSNYVALAAAVTMAHPELSLLRNEERRGIEEMSRPFTTALQRIRSKQRLTLSAYGVRKWTTQKRGTAQPALFSQ